MNLASLVRRKSPKSNSTNGKRARRKVILDSPSVLNLLQLSFRLSTKIKGAEDFFKHGVIVADVF